MSQKNDSAEGQKREHLNREERKIIERMLRKGADKGEIARTLRRDKSTIKREIRRGSVVKRRKNPCVSRNPKVPEYLERKVYHAGTGQENYEQHRQQCGVKNRVVICSWPVNFVAGKILGGRAIVTGCGHRLRPRQPFLWLSGHNKDVLQPD